jgi:hypothetical protein
MAIPATAVFECRSGGDDLNGGGFNSAAAGVDYSQQNSPQVTIDGATITYTIHSTTTQANIVGYTVHANDIGNCVRIAGGTMTAGRYFITAVDTGNNRWTLDRSGGTAGQTGTGRMGGAVKFPGALTNTTGTTLVAGNIIWIKNDGTYIITTSTAGDGGPVSLVSVALLIEGYETTRGDLGSPPLFDAAAVTTFTFFGSLAGAAPIFRNIEVEGNDNANVVGFSGSSANVRAYLENLIANNCASGFTQVRTTNCYAFSCTTGFGDCYAINCGAYQCSTGFLLTGEDAIYCWATDCTADGFQISIGSVCRNCVAYSNDGDGFEGSSATSQTFIDCVSINNSGYAFNTGTTAANRYTIRIINCFEYNNTLGIINSNVPFIYDVETLTSDPFTNGASQNFTPNNITGGGASLRSASTITYGQTSYLDAGCVQHQDGFNGTTISGWA